MPTLEEVAKYCGVSAMTVSRVINNKGYVAEATRKRINDAIEKLNYRPNLVARSLVTNKTYTVGVLMTRLENPIYSLIVSGLTQAAVKSGYDVILSTSSDVDSSIKSINTLINKQIDALIILPMELRTKQITKTTSYGQTIEGIDVFYKKLNEIAGELEANEFPIVTIGDYILNNIHAYVKEDYKIGATMAVEYLAEKGHKNIGFLSHELKDRGIWGERYKGFLEGMKKCDCPVIEDNIEECIDTIESGYVSMKRLLEKSHNMTAVYCANDVIAVGAVNAILSEGLKIPEDISVMGHDGSLYSEAVHPSLTTVSIEPYEIGKEAFNLARDVSDKVCTGKIVTVLPRIIERKSVQEI